MDPILGALFIAGVIWAGRKAAGQVRDDFRKSRARSGARPWQHAAAWWSREASRGFPVTRAGFGRGWLAHQTALDQRRAQREEARTSHLEARASIASEWAEHRRRQQEAQARIDQAREPQAQPADELAARRGSRRVDGQPETDADRRFFDERESGYDGPLNSDGRRPDLNDPQQREDAETLRHMRVQSQNGAGDMATATEGSYTTVLTAANNQAAQADYAAADIAQQRKTAEQILEEMQSANVDAASLSDQADHVARLRAAEEAVNQVTESGAQVSSGLERRHGGIKEAHDDAPVEAAESGWYKD